jgi:predicted dehydrogenase
MNDPGNFRLDPERGGGAFHDLARYPLSAALHFLRGELGQFTGISFYRNGLNTGMHGTALSSANELFQFGIDFAQQYESFYELVGEKGIIRVDRAFTTPADIPGHIQVRCGTRDLSFDAPPADHFRLMIEHVCRLVGETGEFGAAHERSRRIARLGELLRTGCVARERD